MLKVFISLLPNCHDIETRRLETLKLHTLDKGFYFLQTKGLRISGIVTKNNSNIDNNNDGKTEKGKVSSIPKASNVSIICEVVILTCLNEYFYIKIVTSF